YPPRGDVNLRQLGELLGHELADVALVALAPLAPRVDRAPALELGEAEACRDELLGVARGGVEGVEAREGRPRDRAAPGERRMAWRVEPGRRVVVRLARSADEVRGRRVDDVLDGAHLGGVQEVLALARARERRGAVDEHAGTLQREDARQLGV